MDHRRRFSIQLTNFAVPTVVPDSAYQNLKKVCFYMAHKRHKGQCLSTYVGHLWSGSILLMAIFFATVSDQLKSFLSVSVLVSSNADLSSRHNVLQCLSSYDMTKSNSCLFLLFRIILCFHYTFPGKLWWLVWLFVECNIRNSRVRSSVPTKSTH